jgi:serine/threonine protein kinase/uncharacterized protein HemY
MTSERTGQIIRGYEVRESLGKGGCGVVYRAYQPILDREVAIKFILPEFAADPDFLRNLESEAKLIARLAHPFIVPVHEYWHGEDATAIVMRCFNGGNLRKKLHEHPRFTIEEASRLVEQIGNALGAAHRLGIVHRDLKPENILMDEYGNAFLTDFGIAAIIDSEVDEMFAGTLEYASIEQLHGSAPVPQMDIYSLGLILYEILSGVQPFHGLSVTEVLNKHMNENVPVIEDLHELYEVNKVIQQATAKNAEQRYRDAFKFVEAFRQAISQRETTAAPLIFATVNESLDGVLQEHIDYMYKRLDEMYERLKEEHSSQVERELKGRIDELQKEISYRNFGLKMVEQNAPFTPPISLTPPALQHRLIGVEATLESSKTQILQGESMILTGPTGVGKTEMASWLARDEAIKAHFNGRILWLAFGQDPDLFSLLGECLEAFGVNSDQLANMTTLEERKKRFISLAGGHPTLLVLDSVWEVEHIHHSVYDSRVEFAYIVTTSVMEVAAAFLWEQVELNTFSLDARFQLLSSLIPNLPRDNDNIRTMLERIGGIPRDIYLLGLRFRKAATNVQRLSREIDRALKQPDEAFAQGYAALALTINYISEGAKEAFSHLSVLPPEPSTFSEALIEGIGIDLAYVDELVDYSLVKSDDARYLIHPSFAAYAQEKYPPEDTVYRKIYDYLSGFVILNARNFSALSLEYRNIQKALDIAIERGFDFVDAVFALRDFWSAKGMIEQASIYLEHALINPSLTLQKNIDLLLALAKMYQKQGRLDEAEQRLDEGLRLVPDQLDLLIAKADLWSLKGAFEEAEPLYLALLEKAEQQKKQTALSEIYNGLGVLYSYSYPPEPEKAKEYYLQSLALARQNKNRNRICTALQNLGLIETQFYRNFAQAKTYILESLSIARELGDEEVISSVLQSRGLLELSQDNYAQALVYYEEALHRARVSNSIEAITFALVSLANALISPGEIARAELYLEEGAGLAATIGNPTLMGFICYVTIKAGEMRIIRDELDAQEALWIKIIDAARQVEIDPSQIVWMEDTLRRIQSVPDVSFAYYQLGKLEGEGHDYQQAKLHFEKAIEFSRSLDKQVEVMPALVHALLQLKDYQGAEAALQQLFDRGVDPVIMTNPVNEIGEARLQAQQFEGNRRFWEQLTRVDEFKNLATQIVGASQG